jgi:hypothetical protein
VQGSVATWTTTEASFMLCDGCQRGGHCQCLSLTGVLDGDWLCQWCVHKLANDQGVHYGQAVNSEHDGAGRRRRLR